MDVVAKEAEGCDCPQGFQSCHFLGDGTSSDLGSSKLREEHPDRTRRPFSFILSPTVFDTLMELYHTIMRFSRIVNKKNDAYMLLTTQAL